MIIKPELNMEQTILETAERLFLENGFASTSTTQIAKVVGCNQALIHYYFRTKENLFNTIFEQKFKTFFQHIFEIRHLEGMSFAEKLRRIIETHFDLLQQNPKMPNLILAELSRQPKQIKTLREKLFTIPENLHAEFNAELQKEIEAGRVRKIEIFDIVFTMVALNVGVFTILPVVSEVFGFNEEFKKMMIIRRREENVQAVLNFIKP